MTDRATVALACCLVTLKLTAGTAVYLSCAREAGEAAARAERDRRDRSYTTIGSGGGSCASCSRPWGECSCAAPDWH